MKLTGAFAFILANLCVLQGFGTTAAEADLNPVEIILQIVEERVLSINAINARIIKAAGQLIQYFLEDADSIRDAFSDIASEQIDFILEAFRAAMNHLSVDAGPNFSTAINCTQRFLDQLEFLSGVAINKTAICVEEDTLKLLDDVDAIFNDLEKVNGRLHDIEGRLSSCGSTDDVVQCALTLLKRIEKEAENIPNAVEESVGRAKDTLTVLEQKLIQCLNDSLNWLDQQGDPIYFELVDCIG
ncbi:uncharacterized protein LOC132706147 [Cylas formicarius]|uniref:uncharacterized protein LOC132706147 n=1 Tax=Cylas formicarius TaxID=197179 RepID=UPI002958C5A6|nr:uncharacterized protein LOC132706147 [Cylas formicarius]